MMETVNFFAMETLPNQQCTLKINLFKLKKIVYSNDETCQYE